jgi:hypothetical protein
MQFLFGFAIGVMIALTLAWEILPPTPVVGTIAGLTNQAKEAYLVLVSMSFALDGDLELANVRLAMTSDPEIRGTLRSLAERYITELRPDAQRRSLAKLASALGADSATLRVYGNMPTPTLRLTAIPSAKMTAPPTYAAQGEETARPLSVTQAATAQATVTPTRLDFRVFERVRLTCQQEPGP